MQLSAVAARVAGCLIEKARTTPDQYPLSLNALVSACNQTTNRSPVVRYDDDTVESGLDELRTLELIRREKPHGGRAIKYSELVQRTIPMSDADLAVLCILLLRGPQTPGELKARTERLYRFEDLHAIDDSLQRLSAHEDGALVAQLPREPGRKESRWCDLLQPLPSVAGRRDGSGSERGVEHDVQHDVEHDAPARDRPDVAAVTKDGVLVRIEALEAEVARLAARVDGLDRAVEH